MKRAGRIYKLPELAKTMKIVAKEGTDAFYNGSITTKLLKDLEKINSIITKEDFANYKWASNLINIILEFDWSIITKWKKSF